MAINKKLIHFQTLANFNAQLSAGNILDTSIVFIKDAKKIWTHGQLYDCSGGGGAESPVYVTDFTFADYNKTIDIESLVDAVVKCKPILVPFDSENSGFSTVVSRQIDDEYVTLYCYLSPEYNPVNDKGGEFVFNYLRDTGELDEALIIPLPDRLVSGTNIKTINGQSILGSGDIVIEGGGGSSSGEDIRYFTNFTVEQFIEGCEAETVILRETSELFNAIKNNKIICVPYEGYDKGFLVASYKGGESIDYPDVFLQIGNVLYHAYTGDSYELAGMLPSRETINVVEIEGGEEVYAEISDNTICIITEVAEHIYIVFNGNIIKGSTLRFTTGNNTTLEFIYEVKWVNGIIPTIQPNTCYELSLVVEYGYAYAVLAPFF